MIMTRTRLDKDVIIEVDKNGRIIFHCSNAMSGERFVKWKDEHQDAIEKIRKGLKLP